MTRRSTRFKILLLDAANTIIHKPILWVKYISTLADFGYDVGEFELRSKHKMISEIIHFPDQTSESFYQQFNREVLLSLGILPEENLLNAIFNECTYLPWEIFDDTEILRDLPIKKAILSNFNSSLQKKINALFESIFENVIVSEDVGVGKPDIRFYEQAVTSLGVRPAEILYVGDSLKLDVIPATSIGIEAWLIDRDGNFPYFKKRLNSLLEIPKLIQ